MKLATAIDVYVSKRRAEGLRFSSAQAVLGQFLRVCGDMYLQDLAADQISYFVAARDRKPATCESLFSTMKCFVEYWALREQMPPLALERPVRSQPSDSPFILSRAQVRSLLRAAGGFADSRSVIDGRTLRMLLLLFYATGCRVGELYRLRRRDVDLKKKTIYFTGGSARDRRIPIGDELRSELARYLAPTRSPRDPERLLFSTLRGAPLRRHLIYEQFRRLISRISVEPRSDGRTPRVLDMRYTFAVHRLDQCIRDRKDLGRLLPALSTYMGYSHFDGAERFLSFVPGRFQEDLRKLSPSRGRKRWRNDPELMRFLQEL